MTSSVAVYLSAVLAMVVGSQLGVMAYSCQDDVCEPEPVSLLQTRGLSADGHRAHKQMLTQAAKLRYEVWASDQSNSVPGMSSRGINGSFLWIWKSCAIERQIEGGPDAEPIACTPNRNKGPCDLLEVFPGDLEELDANGGKTGKQLSELMGFGRLHGTLPDPFGLYVAVSVFAPKGGFVGIMDTKTKAAVALFRVSVSIFDSSSEARSIHMCFWSSDGSHIILANLHGKILERIDVTRNRRGKIVKAAFNRAASLGVGKGQAVGGSATYFAGRSAKGGHFIGEIIGEYSAAAFSDLTPAGVCKENGCNGTNGAAGGRPNNVIICPIPSSGNNVYITVGGGGLLVADLKATPMKIVAEYGNQVVNGAGCGGAENKNSDMLIDAGVSASAAGATASTFTVYAFADPHVRSRQGLQNTPAPRELFKDSTNTRTLGNLAGPLSNPTGQLPGTTTRRDAHGAAPTPDGEFVHIVDRIQNKVEVFKAGDDNFRKTYDLTSADGQGTGVGPCQQYSVVDDAGLPKNDPAPDLIDGTPDGRYMMMAFRGPAPVTVPHTGQGSCPGVGVVKLADGGATGRLATVLRTVNTIDTAPVAAPGGYPYSGAERSDVHGAVVIRRRCPKNLKSSIASKLCLWS